MSRGRVTFVAILTALAVLAGAAVASAAPSPPPNDGRNQATMLTIPTTVTGTTAGATVAPVDPPVSCAKAAGSVWYQVNVGATAPDRLAVQVDANGQLDAAVDVFIKQRSQNVPVTCQRTAANGEALFVVHPQAQTTYLIRVSQLANSSSSSFKLHLFVPPAPASAPGRALPVKGAAGSLERVVHVSAAFSTRLKAGTTYVVNLFTPIAQSMRLAIFAPGTTSFDTTPVKSYPREGYRLFTPRVSGKYSLLVGDAHRVTGAQPFHLQVAPATNAQTAPGLPIANHKPIHSKLEGTHVAVVRLYHFDVTRRTNLQLRLTTGENNMYSLQLLTAGGKTIDCECDTSGDQTITATTKPGRYFVAVRARGASSGRFTLLRQSRAITRTLTTVDGERFVQVAPGAAVTVQVHVTAAADGPATLEIDRFDPVARWQFYRTVKVRVSNGFAELSFIPPSAGQWAFHANFLGSRDFSSSNGDTSRVLSAGPLTNDLAPVPLL